MQLILPSETRKTCRPRPVEAPPGYRCSGGNAAKEGTETGTFRAKFEFGVAEWALSFKYNALFCRGPG